MGGKVCKSSNKRGKNKQINVDGIFQEASLGCLNKKWFRWIESSLITFEMIAFINNSKCPTILDFKYP